MPRKGDSDEQIVFALKQEENGAMVPDLSRKSGITDQNFFRGKHQFEGLGVSELRELRHLRDEMPD